MQQPTEVGTCQSISPMPSMRCATALICSDAGRQSGVLQTACPGLEVEGGRNLIDKIPTAVHDVNQYAPSTCIVPASSLPRFRGRDFYTLRRWCSLIEQSSRNLEEVWKSRTRKGGQAAAPLTSFCFIWRCLSASTHAMALINNWCPPSKENYELILFIWQFFPLVSHVILLETSD